MSRARLVARLVPRFALLACLSFGTSASAGEPQTAASDDGQYQQDRTTAMPAKDRASGAPATTFERAGCLNDPSKCKCQSKDKAKSATCAAILGHFCPDSTLRYLASQCMDLFGGASLCQCAAQKQIEGYIKAEDKAKAKAEKAEKAKKPKAEKKPIAK